MIGIVTKEKNLKSRFSNKLFKPYNRISITPTAHKNEVSDYINLNKKSKILVSKPNKLEEVLSTNKLDISREDEMMSEGYARKLFNKILHNAVSMNSSDIHIEPSENYLMIRVRVDGDLKEIERLSIDIYPSLCSVIKLESSMDITEKRLPQDGSLSSKVKDIDIDIRVSTLLTIYGEKIVLRILNKNSFLRNKKELGFSQDAIVKINKIVNNKSGILLVTGSTGCGKTTTVYSILNELNNINKNIMTIEDPVEYKIDNINQIQVSSKFGLDFNTGLRAMLRQDPDIIMIGEIRDVETAQIAIRAAITGHLVISTMHTNDGLSAITRLIDMNIPPYLINESLVGVISQKLVKKVCNKCNGDKYINLNLENNINEELEVGCEECNHGYSGRTAIYEIIEINDEIRESIKSMRDKKHIKEIAIKSGMITFEDSINDLIKNRITTIEECKVV